MLYHLILFEAYPFYVRIGYDRFANAARVAFRSASAFMGLLAMRSKEINP